MNAATASWPPLQSDFLRAFKHAGASYCKKLPEPAEVLIVDFFAGAGGMSWGFENTRQSHLRFRHVGAIDINVQALRTLALNVDAPTFTIDIRELAAHPEQLLELIPELEERDRYQGVVFVGCPPCQGFSAHRKKDPRDDPRNSLIAAFASLVVSYSPDVLVMENVPEMLNGRYRRYYEQAAAELRDSGYVLTEDVLDLSQYGVPQRRRRAVVFGSRRAKIALPKPIMEPAAARTVRDAISHLPPLNAGETDGGDPWHRAPAHIPRIVERIRRIPPDGGDRRDLPADEQLACHAHMRPETPGFTDVYGRLRWDKPSVTITAKSSTPSCGRFLHPEQHRNISIREAALLQAFPSNYVFAGGFVDQYRQIGEAVPPLFARHLAYAVLDHFRPLQHAVYEVNERLTISIGTQRAVPDNDSVLGAVDLFCGAGGLSLGMEAAGLPTLFAADLDSAAVDSFQKNIGPQAVVADVLEPKMAHAIDAAVGSTRFVLVGGPPCQGFSQQRRGSNLDTRNRLVLRFADLAMELARKPDAIVLENVMYLDSPRGRHILAAYIRKLRNHGYAVRRCDLNSADFGVPQTRKRIVVIAVQGALVPPDLEPLTGERWVTIGEGVASLPLRAQGQPRNHVSSRESSLNVRRMSFVDMGRGRTAIPRQFQLKCHRSYDGHLDVFGRLDWFGHARTITGGFDSSSRGEYTHPYLNRSITAREAARIQGFPDDFEFLGNKADVRRQIGNAVPPPLGYAIGKALVRALQAG